MLIVDWKLVLILWLPIFGAAMWYGIANRYEDMALYTVAVALAAWGISGKAVSLFRRWQWWRLTNRPKQDEN